MSFNSPLNPLPQGPLFGTQTPAPQIPNIQTLLANLNQPPGQKFLHAIRAPQPPKTPLPLTPPAPTVAKDPMSVPIDAAYNAMTQAGQTNDAAYESLRNYQPYNQEAPQYTAPPKEKPNTGETIGHLLAGLVAPRLAPFAQQGINYSEKQRQEDDARNERTAQLQYQAAQADAQRKEHYSEVDLGKREALAAASEKNYEDAVLHYSTAIDRAQRAQSAQQRAQAYADNFASQIDARKVGAQQREQVIQETAKRDAQNFGIKNQQIAAGIWRTNMQEFDKMRAVNIRSDIALNVASQKANVELLRQKMSDQTVMLHETMREKYGADMAEVNNLQKQIGQVLSAAQAPGATDEQIQAAAAMTKKLSDQVTAKLNADSGGAFTAAQSHVQQELIGSADEGMAESPATATPNVTNNYYGGVPNATAGMQQPGQAPGAAPPQVPPGQMSLQGFLGLHGAPANATPAAPPGAIAQPQGGAPTAAPPVKPPDPAEVAHVKQLIAAHPGDAAGAQKAVQIFASRHPGMSPQAAAQILGVGAAPQAQQQQPAQPQRPAAPTPGQPPAAQPQQHAQAPQAAPQQAPMQFALSTAQAANAKDGPNAPPPQQQVQILARALVAKYKGMSPQQATQIAQQAVQLSQPGPITQGLQKAGEAVGGAIRGIGNAAQNFERGWLGGGSAPPNPPQAGL